MSRSTFDYIIIGNGLAGLQLALALASDGAFSEKHVALIDPLEKNINDKTWSFWEIHNDKWSKIPHSAWQHAKVHTAKKNINLKLAPYTYKSIKSLDFYKYAKSKLEGLHHFHFIKAKVVHTEETPNSVIVKTQNANYQASHIFDSRVPEDFYTSKKSINIIQHFKGVVIKVPNPTFDTSTMVMMDYRLKDGKQTTFTYVLPFSKTEALVEFTYFTAQTVNETVYDTFIEKYIKTYLNIETYTIVDSEIGQIPMTTFPFHKYNTQKITKIGTGGGWVKASTGYAFKHTEKKVNTIIANLKANTLPSKQLFKRKHLFYDKIFLKVLLDHNDKGEWLFEQFYSKNKITTMFHFLDETSSFKEELKIMSSLFSWRFIKAFFKTL